MTALNSSITEARQASFACRCHISSIAAVRQTTICKPIAAGLWVCRKHRGLLLLTLDDVTMTLIHQLLAIHSHGQPSCSMSKLRVRKADFNTHFVASIELPALS